MAGRQENRGARYGRPILIGLWTYAAYVVLHYALLIIAGPRRLYAWLGEEWYNRLIPAGGFGVLVIAIFGLLIWGVPYAVAVLGSSRVLSLTRAGPRTVRWLAHAVGVLSLVALHVVPLDGWPWSLWPLLGGDDTEYAAGYSGSGFLSIRSGMTSLEVEQLLGPPLKRLQRGGTTQEWLWTRSPNDGDYRVRAVVFENGRVVQKLAQYYID